MNNDVMNWVQFGQSLITWVADTGQAFGFWGDNSNGQYSSGGGYTPPLSYQHMYGSGQAPLQSGFGGINITTLLLIGAGIYLITKR